jgi:rare lipoprotein A
MGQHKKTALVLRVGALAISTLVVSAARAAGDLSVAEPTIAEQPFAMEQGLAREETTTLVETIAAEENRDSREAESAAADLNPLLVCWTSAELRNLAMPNEALAALASAETIIGIASFYGKPQQTASGEQFNPKAFTAAAQLEIRAKFGGIRFGRKYQPAYAVAEYGNKKLILKFNDVGPLRPGRKFDLSPAAMAYFGGLKKGLLRNVKVTPLPLGQTYRPGPVTDPQLAALGIGKIGVAVATARSAITPQPDAVEPKAPVSPPADAVSISARLYVLEPATDES